MSGTWQYLERSVGRLFEHEGFEGVRIVGQTGDRGADILAHRGGKRWLTQVKFRSNGRIGIDVVDETVEAARFYRADIPVIATNRSFTDEVNKRQAELMASGVPIQLWDGQQLKTRLDRLPNNPVRVPVPRTYQEGPITAIVEAYEDPEKHSALVIMATGLGKTFVAADAIRRLREKNGQMSILVLAHRNGLVYQLERAFWPLLEKQTVTTVWNGYELPDHASDITFACVDSVETEANNTGRLPIDYDIVVVDECHHVGSPTYQELLETISAGNSSGPFLIGLTATPWRNDNYKLQTLFGEAVAQIDIVEGLKREWLSNVDYRMHLDNIDWEEAKRIHDLTPRGINRTLFIAQWDDAVVNSLREVWNEQANPRAIVFCGTIDHAITMRDKINAMGFARAEALYSGNRGAPTLSQAHRNKILCDFHDGDIDVLCSVDILNEGIDLPDVNIVVFQRVTHSRRIFVQQLGRGLRISEGKEKVIVLDFVSDIRRIAAGIDLQNRLGSHPMYIQGGLPLRSGSKVRFMDASGENKGAEGFLREWLEDVASIESAGEDESILKFPPDLG